MCSKVRRNGALWPGDSGDRLEVDRIWVRPTGLQNVEHHVIRLRDFAKRVLEGNVDNGMRHRFVPSIGHSSFDISNARPHEIFRGAHFHI